jgi:hypothetical protein
MNRRRYACTTAALGDFREALSINDAFFDLLYIILAKFGPAKWYIRAT